MVLYGTRCPQALAWRTDYQVSDTTAYTITWCSSLLMKVLDSSPHHYFADPPEVVSKDLYREIAHATGAAVCDQGRNIVSDHWPSLSLDLA